MKNLRKEIILTTAYLFPFSSLKKGMHPPVLPFYHTVEREQPEYISKYHIKNEKQFEKDLDFLLNHYVPVTLDELKKPDKIPSNAMHLSFDDGMKSCSNSIAPILLRKGIPATFFINPAFVDNDNLFHRFMFDMIQKQGIKLPEELKKYNNKEKLKEALAEETTNLEQSIKMNAIYMGMHELKQLKKEGFSIGAHSMDHPEFYNIEPSEQFRQVKDSIQWVDKHFSPATKAFAFPFTDDGVQNALLQKIHKENLVDLSFGTAGLKHDCFSGHLQRIPMERSRYIKAKSILKYEYFYYRIRKVVNKNTVQRDD